MRKNGYQQYTKDCEFMTKYLKSPILSINFWINHTNINITCCHASTPDVAIDLSLKITYTLIAILLFSTNCNAQVKITVDSAYRHIFLSEKLTLPRGEITSIDLHSNKFGDHYEFRYTTTAPIKILLIKTKDIEGENPTPNFLLNQTLVGPGQR